jgi:two-component system response regulator
MSEHPIELLLVEDSPRDAELTLLAFQDMRFANRVHLVRDGEEALEFVFATGRYAGRDVDNSPRVVLLDLKLPKVDGLEVLRRIRADPRTRTLPVVVLTSSNQERDVIEAYALGVNSYIVKPVDFDRFSQSIRDLGLYWMVLNEPPIEPREAR